MSVSTSPDRARPIFAPQIADRLGWLTIFAALYYLQCFSHFSIRYDLPADNIRNIVYISFFWLSVATICLGRFHQLLFLLALGHAAQYIARMPVTSNNDTMAFFFSVIVVVGYVYWLIKDRPGGRDGLFTIIAGPGRWILAGMYFYGIYHKINTDFLDPAVSCATVLYEAIMGPYGLENWSFGRNAAIWTTFIAEGIAMLVLFSSKYKKIGFMIGIPFHIAIGLSGFSYFINFSTIVLVTYVLFLPRDAITHSTVAMRQWFGSEQRAAWVGWLFTLACVVGTVLALGMLWDWQNIRTQQATFRYPFVIYSVVFVLFVAAFVPWRTSDTIPAFRFKPAFLAVIPILYFLNGFSPYLGLKTESAVAMFSNLRTENNETNHLIHGQLPFAFNYQNDLVYLEPSTIQGIMQFPEFKGNALPRFEFDKILSRNPGLELEFTYNGVLRTNDETWENTYETGNLFERNFLIFRTVDLEGKKECSH